MSRDSQTAKTTWKTEISYSSCCRKKRQNFLHERVNYHRPLQTLRQIWSNPSYQISAETLRETLPESVIHSPESNLISGLPSKPPIRHAASHNSNPVVLSLISETAVIVITFVKLRGGGKRGSGRKGEEGRTRRGWVASPCYEVSFSSGYVGRSRSTVIFFFGTPAPERLSLVPSGEYSTIPSRPYLRGPVNIVVDSVGNGWTLSRLFGGLLEETLLMFADVDLIRWKGGGERRVSPPRGAPFN